MLKIRLQRVGRKHEPVFRLVLTDSKNSTKSGRFLEILGNYDSRDSEKAVFKTDRISHWMAQGAQVSDTTHNLLVTRKLIEGKKRNSLPKKQAIVKEVAPEAKAAATAPKVEEKKEVVEEAAPAPHEETPVAETTPEITPALETTPEPTLEIAPEEVLLEPETPAEVV